MEKITKWIENIEKNADRKKKVLILVGNKIDINRREVTTEEGMNFAKERNMKYFESSARTGFDVENALLTVNRFLREGFKSFIEDKKVKSQKEFDKLLQEYGE